MIPVILGLPNHQRQSMFALQRAALDAFISLNLNDLPAQELYAAVLPWKGLAFEGQLIEHQLLQRDPDGAQLLDDYQHAASSYAAYQRALQQGSPSGLDIAHRRTRLADLQAQVRSLELQLAKRVQGDAVSLRREAPPLSAITRGLPSDGALVDLLVYDQWVPGGADSGEGGSQPRLLAFIARPTVGLVRIDLGPWDPLQKAARSFQSAVESPITLLSMVRRLGGTLYDAIWSPLLPHLSGVSRVFISPDHALGRLPFGALPHGDSRWLIEDYTFSTLPLPRLLASSNSGKPDRKPSKAERTLLVYDPDFDNRNVHAKGDDRLAHSVRGSTLTGRGTQKFSPLAAAQEEAWAVRDAFLRGHPQSDIIVMSGAEASESSVRRELSSARWAHLITHGFYTPTSVEVPPSISDPYGPVALDVLQMGSATEVLSGIALAGANLPAELLNDDGVLTALEVAALDLSGLELVTLSACRSGAGAEWGGQPLMGLQRAFHVAGARRVVASLFNVPDEQTMKLMSRFYENHWPGGMDEADALREAQLWMIRGEAGTAIPTGASQGHPAYWAGFVVSGNP